MARKKIVFVIVEGPSDEEALGVLLYKYFSDDSVHVHIMHKDITTEYFRDPTKNIVTSISREISNFANANHFKKSDFKEIIHLTDTDGAFIHKDCVIQDDSIKQPFYSEQNIRTDNKLGIENRNATKCTNINKLISKREIWDVPYSIYYMSCNLDHVLYNKLNTSDSEKEYNAVEFALKYRDQLPKFIHYISNSDFSVNGDYLASWSYIKQGTRSLERHTNLGIRLKANQ